MSNELACWHAFPGLCDDCLFQSVLDSASAQVAKWPEWRRSEEVRRQLEKLKREKGEAE